MKKSLTLLSMVLYISLTAWSQAGSCGAAFKFGIKSIGNNKFQAYVVQMVTPLNRYTAGNTFSLKTDPGTVLTISNSQAKSLGGIWAISSSDVVSGTKYWSIGGTGTQAGFTYNGLGNQTPLFEFEILPANCVTGTSISLWGSGDPNSINSANYQDNLVAGGSGGCNGYTGNDPAGTSIPCSVLPIKLMSFSGRFDANCQMHLEWQVAEAVNFSHFEVEQAVLPNTTVFNKIADVNYIPSTTVSRYSYIISGKKNVPAFYRLKMVDIDGKYSYSGVMILISDCQGKVGTGMKILPNPASKGNLITVTYNTGQDINSSALLAVTDMNGKKIQQSNVIISKGNNVYSIKLDTQAKGVYLVTLESPDQSIRESEKLTLL